MFSSHRTRSQTDGTASAAPRHPRLIGRAARRFAPLATAVAVLAAFAGGIAGNASAGVRFDDGAQGGVTLVCDQRTGQVQIESMHYGLGWNISYDVAIFRNGTLVRPFTGFTPMYAYSSGGGTSLQSYGNRWEMLVIYRHVRNNGSVVTFMEWAPVSLIHWGGRTDYGYSYRACIV